jgi:arylsulfatase A-like enzyme/regulator of sirC expression with transglutaminase-like and TPR domain
MRHRLLCAFLFLTVSPLACGKGTRSCNTVILIVIDTLRADHVGCYGDPEAKTPNLDALAAHGIRFADATTPAPITLAATSSLMTGRWPFHHGVRDNERYVLPPSEVTLAERFQKAGWRTGAVVGSAILASDRGMAQGFESYDDAFQPPFPVYQPSLEFFAESFGRTQRRANVVTDLAMRTADGFGRDAYFLFVHYFDVHSYYDPPPGYAALHPHRPYDGEVSYVDAEIGRLLKHLESRHPLVVVVADHGEGLHEHGETEHGFLLYQSTLQVPVLVRGPGIPASRVRQDPISLVDIAPTLTNALHLPKDGPPQDGRALDWNQPEAAPFAIYSETCRTLVSYGWSELRAIREGSMKLISGPEIRLFDLAKDPHERAPVWDGNRDRVDAARERLVYRLRQDLNTMTGGETRQAILTALGQSSEPDRHELLESLGYVAGNETPPDHPGHAYPNPEDELPRWEAAQREKALYRRGLSLTTHGRLNEAVAAFDTVLVREPHRADVLYNRALARRKLGDEAGFTQDLDSALSADQRYVPALAARANVDEKQGREDLALSTWSRVLEIEPTNADALRSVSEIYLRKSAYDKALPYLRTLVSNFPQDAPARFNLGLAALKAGRETEAREHLEAFLNLAPGDPRAGEVRELLGTLR